MNIFKGKNGKTLIFLIISIVVGIVWVLFIYQFPVLGTEFNIGAVSLLYGIIWSFGVFFRFKEHPKVRGQSE